MPNVRAAAVLLLLVSVPALAKSPRLTLVITLDSVGTDVLLRNRPRLKGAGLATLLNQGAFFTGARYEYAETVTAAGHATLATGANPWRHGVISNQIVNRATGKFEHVLADPRHPVLEAPLNDRDDTSPENLMAETVGDRLRLATYGQGKVVSLSTKARAAIAMGGRLGQAYWYSEADGKFVTGTYYAKEFPAWLKALNEKKPADAFFGKDWTLSQPAAQYGGEDDRAFETDWYGLGRTFPHKVSGGLAAPGPQYYAALAATPSMNELLVQTAKAAIEGEQLGKDDVPDLLSVSFSATDRVYHLYGPYSWEMQDVLIRLDKALGDLLTAAEKAAGGRANLVVALSADHGGAAVPEEWAAAGLPAVRLSQDSLAQALGKELASKFGAPNLVSGIENLDVYLSPKAIADKKLDGLAVRRWAAQWLAQQPGVAMATARDDLNLLDPGANAGLTRALRLGYYPERSGDVLFVLRPYHVLTPDASGSDHGTPYSYDAEVPVLFYGRGVKAGTYPGRISVVDVAPTLSALLEIGAPASAEGTARPEAFGR